MGFNLLRPGAFTLPVNGAEEIKIASTGAGLSTLPLEIAARKGFFRDEGFDVLTITMRTNIAVNALLTRSVEYATPSTSAIKAASAGLPVKTVAVLLGRPDYFLTVKPDVRTLRDLKGKRIAIGSFGAAADLALRTVAKQKACIPPRSHSFANGRSRGALRCTHFRQRRRDDLDSAVQPASGESRLQRPALVRRTLRATARRTRRPGRNYSEKSQASLRRNPSSLPRHGLRQRQSRRNHPGAGELAPARSRSRC